MKSIRSIRTFLGGCLVVLGLLVHGMAVGEAGKTFPADRIDQLVAPIALYPDSVVAQILMAATYPLEVVQAARWREKNPKLKDKALEQALASQPWDPSVKALTNFPDVLKRMNDNLDWTQDLGDAVLAQQADVMAAVQRMRRLAYDAGNLKTSTEQQVIVQEKIIRVEPATQVVYIPAYSPTVVYGTAWAPPSYYYPVYSYPPSYWYPPGYAASNVLSFGLGMAVGAAVWGNWNWGHCDWNGGSVDIDRNFNFERNVNTGDINIGNRAGGGRYGKWEHNVEHRGGVRYRDGATSARFDKQRSETRATRTDRDTARGFDRAGDGGRDRQGDRGTDRVADRGGDRAGDRSGARDSDRQRSGSGSRPVSGASRPAARDTGGGSRSGGRSSAFDVGNSGFTRASSSRGAGSYGGGRSAGGRAASGARAGGGGRGGGGRGR